MERGVERTFLLEGVEGSLIGGLEIFRKRGLGKKKVEKNRGGVVTLKELWIGRYRQNRQIDIYIYCTSRARVHELPQSHSDNREGTLFSWLHVNYAHLASMRFEHSVCCGSLMTLSYLKETSYLSLVLFHLSLVLLQTF